MIIITLVLFVLVFILLRVTNAFHGLFVIARHEAVPSTTFSGSLEIPSSNCPRLTTTTYKCSKMFLLLFLCTILKTQAQSYKNTPKSSQTKDELANIFMHPPASAKPGVLWMWMGANLSKQGITNDLEALKAQGFNRTTMFSLADVTTPWAGYIGKHPTPEIISWTEPWWKLVRHAAEESKRLGIDFGMFNGPGYTASGGKWITPELSMQEISWSDQAATGNQHVSITLRHPTVNPRANQSFPHHNPENGKLEKPEIEARKTYYKDTTWNYFTKASPLISSGLVGPVSIMQEVK